MRFTSIQNNWKLKIQEKGVTKGVLYCYSIGSEQTDSLPQERDKTNELTWNGLYYNSMCDATVFARFIRTLIMVSNIIRYLIDSELEYIRLANYRVWYGMVSDAIVIKFTV